MEDEAALIVWLRGPWFAAGFEKGYILITIICQSLKLMLDSLVEFVDHIWWPLWVFVICLALLARDWTQDLVHIDKPHPRNTRSPAAHQAILHWACMCDLKLNMDFVYVNLQPVWGTFVESLLCWGRFLSSLAQPICHSGHIYAFSP